MTVTKQIDRFVTISDIRNLLIFINKWYAKKNSILQTTQEIYFSNPQYVGLITKMKRYLKSDLTEIQKIRDFIEKSYEAIGAIEKEKAFVINTDLEKGAEFLFETEFDE